VIAGEPSAGRQRPWQPPDAPDLSASLAFDEVLPRFGATTPIGHLPYDLAISSEGFDQLLRSQVECGLLVTSIASLVARSRQRPVPVTAAIMLAALLPEFFGSSLTGWRSRGRGSS